MNILFPSYILMVCVYAYVIYTDFYYAKIANSSTALLAVAYVVVGAATNFATLGSDLAIGAALFGLTFIIWLTTRVIGAGDVKLLGVTGVIIGAGDALSFAVLLLVFSVAFVLLMHVARKARMLPIGISHRLLEIMRLNRVPYGVPIALAAATIVAARMVP